MWPWPVARLVRETVAVEFPSPTTDVASRAEVFLGYLDYFRDTLLRKVGGLDEQERRTSRLPSGWTPLELLKHLRFVELRWIEWGFEGRPVAQPWGDRRGERWYVDDAETYDELATRLADQGRHTRAAVASAELDARGRPGPRWAGAEPATLERVLFHLVQEYARHAGHIDIVAELAGGPIGE
jgi:uncharacterized damage-inducible protein DinB